MGMSLVRAATRNHMDVQGLCITGPAPMQCSGELAQSSLTTRSTQESWPWEHDGERASPAPPPPQAVALALGRVCPASHRGNTVELALVMKALV